MLAYHVELYQPINCFWCDTDFCSVVTIMSIFYLLMAALSPLILLSSSWIQTQNYWCHSDWFKVSSYQALKRTRLELQKYPTHKWLSDRYWSGLKWSWHYQMLQQDSWVEGNPPLSWKAHYFPPPLMALQYQLAIFWTKAAACGGSNRNVHSSAKPQEISMSFLAFFSFFSNKATICWIVRISQSISAYSVKMALE